METREGPFHFLFHAERHVSLVVVLITAGCPSLIGEQTGGDAKEEQSCQEKREALTDNS
jgi:hypothetical protein